MAMRVLHSKNFRNSRNSQKMPEELQTNPFQNNALEKVLKRSTATQSLPADNTWHRERCVWITRSHPHVTYSPNLLLCHCVHQHHSLLQESDCSYSRCTASLASFIFNFASCVKCCKVSFRGFNTL